MPHSLSCLSASKKIIAALPSGSVVHPFKGAAEYGKVAFKFVPAGSTESAFLEIECSVLDLMTGAEQDTQSIKNTIKETLRNLGLPMSASDFTFTQTGDWFEQALLCAVEDGGTTRHVGGHIVHFQLTAEKQLRLSYE